MEKLFEINVRITAFNQVKTEKTCVNFINFDGDCSAPFFQGSILPGGVDTQKFEEGKPGTLSARYILKGKDAGGRETCLFIENNGIFKEDGSIETEPKILCDNEELAPLFAGRLSGRIREVDCPEHNRIVIEIYKHKSQTVASVARIRSSGAI